MIRRYCLPEMADIFTDEARLARWLEIELLATEAWSELGVVPQEDARAARERAPIVDSGFVESVDERERVTDHDVAAFVDVVQGAIGPPAGSWIHYGLTSSDVVDTATSMSLAAAADLLIAASSSLISVLKLRASEFASTPMVGRTHGIHAEPTTFGAKLALWCLQVDRDRERLRSARSAIAVGKLSGAVGTYSNIDPSIEAHVCQSLGLTPVPATQVIARDRHGQYLYACASVGATVELMATEIRHLQRSEVAEAEEGFKPGQKGSSAMPHKRNPIKSEQLSGLARVLRGNLHAGLEDVALWHERDISHSSVERIILPDSSILAHYVLVRMREVIERLVVKPERMMENLERSHGLVFSQPVLLSLVQAGLTRDEAYRIVQESAMRAWEQQVSFRGLLEADERVTAGPEALDEAFDLGRSLRHVGRIFEALEAVT